MPQPFAPVLFGSQTSATSSTTYVTPISVSVPQSSTIVVVAGSSGADTSTGVTDTQGNSYVLAVSNTTNENVQCWVATGVNPLTAGTDTFTTSWTTATTQQKNIIGCYITGAIASDIAVAANGSSATAAVTGGTPLYYNELALAVVQGASGSQPLAAPALSTGGAAFILVGTEQAASQQITSLYYQTVPQPFAPTVSSALNASHTWAMLLVSFAVVDLNSSPVVPQFIAGTSPQQGDMLALWTDPARFYQNRVVYRTSQAKTSTALSAAGGITFIKFDTILEDPWGADNSGFYFLAPFNGWYQVTVCISLTPAAAQVALFIYVWSSAAGGNSVLNDALTITNMPAAGGSGEAVWVVYLAAGDTCAANAAITGSASTFHTNLTAGQQSTMEVLWISS